MINLEAGAAFVAGPMTMDTAATIEAEGRALIDKAVENEITVFDLAGVTDADSSAVAILFSWIREASKRDIELSFRNIPRDLCNLAGVYGVEEFLGPCASEPCINNS